MQAIARTNRLYEGKTEDPSGKYVSTLPSLSANDVADFFQKEIKTAPRVTVVVGNKKKMNLQQLSRYGRVVELKPNDFFRR